MNKNFLKILIIYILFGAAIFEILNKKLFYFLFNNGFEVLLKYIFIGNNDKLLNHIKIADQNFYNIYFGIGLFFLGLFLIYNFKKILFQNNFFAGQNELNFTTKWRD